MAVGVAMADNAGDAEPTRGVLVTEPLAVAPSLGFNAGGAGV